MLNPSKPLTESYSSSHQEDHNCRLLREAEFSDKTFSETLAIINTPYGYVATGLGVKLAPETCSLLAWVYPGTSLYTEAQHAIAVNIVQPRSPMYYLGVVLRGQQRISLEPCKAIPGRCIAQSDATVYVEATVTKRSIVDGGRILLTMTPLVVARAGATTYSRAYGCIVEVAIAFTRVKFYTRAAQKGLIRKEVACRRASENLERLMLCIEAVLHATTDTEQHRAALMAGREASQMIDEVGCTAYTAHETR